MKPSSRSRPTKRDSCDALRRLVNRREPVCCNRLGLALQLERLDRFDLDSAAYELESGLADQDLVGLGGVLQAGGHVHRIAGGEPLLCARDHLAGVHADPSLHAQLREGRPHLHRSPAGPQRVVLVHLRHAEHRHHRVADELLHRAAVRLDDRLHPLEVAGQQRLQRLRIDGLAERGRADHVAEQHGDDLPMHWRIIPCRPYERKIGRRSQPQHNRTQASRSDTNGRRHGVERESEVAGSGCGFSDLQLAFCTYGRKHAAKSRVTHRIHLGVEVQPRKTWAQMAELPSGTVTFLFSDIEESTRLLDELGPEAYREALREHRRVLREVFGRHGGYEVDYAGDAFFVAFQEAVAGAAAAREAQAALADGRVRVRMGLHTGTPLLDPPKYVGRDVHLAARVMGAGHGGQVLLTQKTREQVDEAVRELGEHRLKDFDEPVALFQLGDGAFPPLKTISNTNLPRPASSFVGREREVAEVLALVREGTRLLTLTGPGGSGKTRLAIEVAAELVPAFKAGVFWVGLAALRDTGLVLETVAQTLGAKVELAVHVGERELLFLLDNLEQVVEVAPELAALVEACPNLVLLVTSREVLRVRGEVEYEVLSLAERDAVSLFSERARLPSSPVVQELCRRLDDMPLALELAAARTKVLTPEQILDRLGDRLDLFEGGRDAEPRQATLRATIAWSYDLLAPEDQRLFARLAVFTGGCTLEAVEEVCDADLDTLQSLVEKSLVRRTGDRFWMLETIREHSSERLAESGEEEARRRAHAACYLTLAEGRGADSAGRNRPCGLLA